MAVATEGRCLYFRTILDTSGSLESSPRDRVAEKAELAASVLAILPTIPLKQWPDLQTGRK